MLIKVPPIIPPGSSSSVVPTTTWSGFTVPLRVCILNFLGEDQDEILTLLLVSKSLNTDCTRPGIIWTVIPSLVIRPLFDEHALGCPWTLFENFYNQMTEDDATNQKLQQYRKMVIYNVHKFETQYYSDAASAAVEQHADATRFHGITSLDLSLSTPSTVYDAVYDYGLPHLLSGGVLPNLQKINLSNTGINTSELRRFSLSCLRLETVVWNNITCWSGIELNNGSTILGKALHLRELIMDDSAFKVYPLAVQRNKMFDVDDRNEFIFRDTMKYCKAIERVSILNARYYIRRYDDDGFEVANDDKNEPIKTLLPQAALIKFIRYGPSSLRWFRSNLSVSNKDMLRKERPEIEFV